ncbi:uncharacterized protein RHO17_003830 [Thomomys bottae]
MADDRFLLTRILFFSYCLLTAHCSQPNCTHVKDFEDCLGNAIDFCPQNITCTCKDGEPFCKCPNYRGKWGNYWYMGAKCDQLWNTLDLVLVATLPGVGLALIVAVTIESIHYCRKKSKKNTDDHREQMLSSGFRPQLNLEYAFGAGMSLPQFNQDQSHLQNSSTPVATPLNDPSPPIRLFGKNYSIMSPDHKDTNIFSTLSNNWDGSPRTTKAEGNYGAKYSIAVDNTPPFNGPVTGVSKSTGLQREREYFGYPGLGVLEVPYRMSHTQMNHNY